MALKDCMKKLGKALDPKDRELLESYLEQGLSDQEAIDRLNLVLDKQILDISLQAKKAGAEVKVKRDVMGEVRAIGEQRRINLRQELIDIRMEQDNLSLQREEITWVESNIKHWEHGGGSIDLTNDTQVYMRFEQMGFIHKDAFKLGQFGDGQIKGKNTYELVQSFRAMQDRSSEMLSEIHGLLTREAEILDEIGWMQDGDQVLDENGEYKMGPLPPESAKDINVTYTTKAPWKITSSGDGDLYISRHGAKAGTPHKERQGPNDFAITLDESLLDTNFTFYLLQYLQPKIAARAHGTAQQAIRKKDIEEVLIEHFRSQAREDSGTFYTDSSVPHEVRDQESIANYKAIIKVVEERTLKTGLTQVNSAADAAHVLAEIRKNAAEGMWAAVLDADNNVVGIIEHSRGGIDGTSVYPSMLAGAILTIPGAAKVWFAHNHPSGTLEPSEADRRITARLNGVLDGSGVEIQGHVLVGGGQSTYTLMDKHGLQIESGQKITAKPRNKSVKVFTRKIAGKQEGEAITSPMSAGPIVERMGNPEGVLLLNNRHKVLGFMAMTPQEMEVLKHTGGSERLLRAFSDMNAAAFIVSTKEPQHNAANNMYSFANAGEVRMLDAFYLDQGGNTTSMASQGLLSASSTFYQSSIGFTSGLLTAARTMPQEKGAADQMLALLKKQPGVTKAELEWLDIEEWFEAKGGTITRDEIIDYVDANGIVVEEIQHKDDQAYQGMSIEGGGRKRDIFLKMPEIPEDSLIYSFQIVKDGIADEHVTDEIADDFFTWINTDERMADVQAGRTGQGDRVELQVENVNETQYDLIIQFMNNRALTLIDEQTTDFRAVDEKQQQLLDKAPGLKSNFGFSHFSHKNILAWMRTTERVGPNGEKILMVEEVQSDWHQQGAKRGYADPEVFAELQASTARIDELQVEKMALIKSMKDEGADTDAIGEDYVTTVDALKAEKANHQKLLDKRLKMVPDAPFKGRGWPKLAMKRIIRLAAEEGFDQIAWTTGEQQNIRNRLATHVERLSYDVANRTIFVEAVAGERDMAIQAEPQDFAEYMGEAAAAALQDEIDVVERFYEPTFDPEEGMWTIIDGNGDHYADRYGDFIWAADEDAARAALWDQLNYEDLMPSISGPVLDQMVGEKAKAMPNFYDRELVNLTKEAARKLDKKATVELEGQEIFLEDDAPFGVKLDRVFSQGHRTLEWFVVGASGRTSGPFSSEDVARANAHMHNSNTTKVHTMKITDQMREAALEGQTLHQKKKGSISFDAARKGMIKLTKSRDLSTFLHEAGHLYLEVMGSLSEQQGAPKQITDDYKKILEYLGVSNRGEITREHHELWAESFEKYLHEGNAPSVELQSAFNAFRRWLSDIWARMKGESPDGIILTPEIRDVMDRMLASDAQIAQAKVQQEFTAVFSTAEQMGVSQEVFDAYKESILKENNDAIERETKRLMAAANRDKMTWWKEERAKVRAEVEKEAHGRKVYQAISLLGSGTKPDGSPLDQGSPFKISKDSLVEKFGKDFLRRLPKPWVYTVKGGVDVDVAARGLGYKDGEALVEAMVKAPAMKDWIDYNTDQIMQAQFPDPLLDGSIADEAIKAVHNERRGNILAAEMRRFRQLRKRDQKIVSATKKEAKRTDREAREANKGTLPKRAEMALIKVAAKAKIGAMRIMDVQPHKYLAAESKAGRQAFEAAARSDYEKAYNFKRQQVVNHEMYRAAQRAVENAQKTNNYLSKFSKPRVIQRLGKLGVIDPILAILEGIELKKVTLKEINKRNALQQLAQDIHDGGVVTPIAEFLYHVEIAANGKETVVLNEAPFKNWQELTVDEFEAMKDIIKQLEFQGNKTLSMPVNGEMIVLEDATTELAQTVLDANKIVDIGIGEKTRKQRRKKAVKSGLSHWVSPGVMSRILDGQDWGAFTRMIVTTIRRANVERLVPMQHEAIMAVSELYQDHFTNAELRQFAKKGFATINGETLSLSDVLSIALNHGNDGNIEALLNGIRVDGKLAYPEAEVQAALDKLTERDWLFVQAVWDYLDSYWPALSKMEKQRRGIAPERVEPRAFVVRTADGKELTLRGGYYPLKYNYEHSARGEADVYEDHFSQMTNGTYVSASTRAGATHNRVKNHKMVVQLGLHIIDRHLKEITRDIAIGDEVNFVVNLLNDSGVRNAMQNTNNHVALKELKLWLADVAVGELPANNELERWMAWARVGFTKSKLAYNLYTAALQLTGYAQSIAMVGLEAMAYGAGYILRNPLSAWKDAIEVSAFLRVRYDRKHLAFNKDVTDAAGILKEFGGGLPTIERRAWEAFGRSMFWPIAKMQQLVDLTTWYGAYWKARNKRGQSDTEAVLYADAQVEMAQTSGFFTDRSGVERGTLSATTRQSQFVRLWTTLISYMARKGNLAYMKTNELKRELSFKNSILYATDMLLLFTVEGIASSWIYGRWDWEDDPEELMLQAMKETAASVAAGIPFVREIPSAAFGSGNTAIGGLSNDLFKLYIQAGQGEMDPALRKAFVNSFGTIFHLPASQTNRLLEALIDEDDPEILEYLTGTRD
jgi:hypothetical protein